MVRSNKQYILRFFGFFGVLLAAATSASGQRDSSLQVTLTGYLEAYYTHDFEQPDDGNRPGYLYSHARAQEVAINLGFLKASVASDRIRANFALMAGTYANRNLAAEPGTLRNIFEANIGVKPSKNHNFWVEAGVFPSHIGFESAIGKDCQTLTRSLVADNSPYYESGAKATWNSKNGRWLVSGLVLNGWQRIERSPDDGLGVGTQVQYRGPSGLVLNSSSYMGRIGNFLGGYRRWYHNLYVQSPVGRRMNITLGIDSGADRIIERVVTLPDRRWWTPTLIVQVALNSRMSLSGRVEYFDDSFGAVMPKTNFEAWGGSVNLDVRISPNALWRTELRSLTDRSTGNPAQQNNALTTALAVWF
jgi:Putative beta-barrel porin-2, OmpL-like. bbp2